MKLTTLSVLAATLALAQGFAPIVPHRSAGFSQTSTSTALSAKYKTMDEILALFPEEKPVLVNFYDAKTEDQIKNDIFRAKQLLADRLTLVSVKQQDYPELAKLWNCDEESPAMILFKDGNPVARMYGQYNFLEIAAKFGKYAEDE